MKHFSLLISLLSSLLSILGAQICSAQSAHSGSYGQTTVIIKKTETGKHRDPAELTSFDIIYSNGLLWIEAEADDVCVDVTIESESGLYSFFLPSVRVNEPQSIKLQNVCYTVTATIPGSAVYSGTLCIN